MLTVDHIVFSVPATYLYRIDLVRIKVLCGFADLFFRQLPLIFLITDKLFDYLVGNVKDLDRNELTEYEKELLAAARNSDDRAKRDALKLLKDYRNAN